METDNTMQMIESALKDLNGRQSLRWRRVLPNLLWGPAALCALMFLGTQVWPGTIQPAWIGPLYLIFFIPMLPSQALRAEGNNSLAESRLKADLKHAMSPAHDEATREALWTEISARMNTANGEDFVDPNTQDEVSRLGAARAAERRLQAVLTMVSAYQKPTVWEGWERALSVAAPLPVMGCVFFLAALVSEDSGVAYFGFFYIQAITIIMVLIFHAFLGATRHRHAQLAVLERQARDLTTFLHDEAPERGADRLRRWIQLRAEHDAQLQLPSGLLGITLAI